MELIGKIENDSKTTVCRMFSSVAGKRRNSFRNHKHAEFELSLVINGSGVYDTERGKTDISAGDVFLFSTNEYHCITDIFGENDSDCMELLNLQFSPAFVWRFGCDYLGNDYLGAFLDRPKNISSKLDKDNPDFDKVLSLFLSIRQEFALAQTGYRTVVKSKILELLVILRRSFFPPQTQSRSDKRRIASSEYSLHLEGIENAMNYIDSHFSLSLTLDQLAKKAYMPRTYFCAVFKRLNGLTPWQYINIRRIDKALALLKRSDETVLKIAMRCGFNNTANFNRIFKKITGQTPGEYRKNAAR